MSKLWTKHECANEACLACLYQTKFFHKKWIFFNEPPSMTTTELRNHIVIINRSNHWYESFLLDDHRMLVSCDCHIKSYVLVSYDWHMLALYARLLCNRSQTSDEKISCVSPWWQNLTQCLVTCQSRFKSSMNHFPMYSSMSEWPSDWMSAEERASEASSASAEQTNEWAVQVNERTEKRMAQYSRRGFHGHSTRRASSVFKTQLRGSYRSEQRDGGLCDTNRNFALRALRKEEVERGLFFL